MDIKIIPLSENDSSSERYPVNFHGFVSALINGSICVCMDYGYGKGKGAGSGFMWGLNEGGGYIHGAGYVDGTGWGDENYDDRFIGSTIDKNGEITIVLRDKTNDKNNSTL